MNPKLEQYFRELKARGGLTAEREEKIITELNDTGTHAFTAPGPMVSDAGFVESFYKLHDLTFLQDMPPPSANYTTCLQSIDELLERDKLREKDGFPRKIRVGRLIKPGKGGKDKVVVVPTTVEEKFIHDNTFKPSEEGEPSGGSGDGEEGDVIGEQPVRDGGGSGAGPGEGESGPHEMESSAYDLGKILTEKFELPNLKDKGKKRSLTRYTYDMTDRHRRFGQILDKKATLKKIVETNISLGNLPKGLGQDHVPDNTSHQVSDQIPDDASDDKEDTADDTIDPTKFLIAPSDMIYRVLSREKDYESQAMVFFLRDYSGSMVGKPTELVVSQHVMIYSWLLYQYEKQVESRFILHDTEAKEVPDFYTYYNSRVAGGTKVASAFKLVHEIITKENLFQDYNIYIFHGTDGDDWDTDGKETIPEIKKVMAYVNRIGITVAKHASGSETEVEKYLEKSGMLKDNADLIRMDVMDKNADEPRLIEGIKKLISQ